MGAEDKIASAVHKRVWFRNVYTEPVGSLGVCANTSAPLVTKATQCTAIPAVQKSTSAAPSLKPIEWLAVSLSIWFVALW